MIESRKRTVPHAGDIVIYGRDCIGVYLLSAFQLASRITCATYDEAIRDATAFAAKNHVDAWYTVDAQTYQPVARHRGEQTLALAA
jgi:hypothetical protein